MKLPEDGKPETWHRFFGASANNAAWTLVELPTEQVNPHELLDAAHAAAWHWQHVGTELNRMRALLLLALAHAKVGLGRTAMAYAEEARAYFPDSPSARDMDIAFVHVAHAHAASAAGDKDAHVRSYAMATRAIAAIGKDEDRNVVQCTFRHVPSP